MIESNFKTINEIIVSIIVSDICTKIPTRGEIMLQLAAQVDLTDTYMYFLANTLVDGALAGVRESERAFDRSCESMMSEAIRLNKEQQTG